MDQLNPMDQFTLMQRLNLPEYDLKIKKEGDQILIFDSIRKKYVVLTKEEWVRQNFAAYLVREKNFPPSLISVEMGLKLHKMQKRSDIVLFNNRGEPKLIVECKAPDVKITQQAFDQAARYNMSLKVDYLIVTNGLKHFCCMIDYDKRDYQFLKDIPDYSKI